MEENKEVLLTQEGYDKLEKELEYLRTEKRAGGKNKTIENLKEEFNQHTLEIGRYHIKWEYARGNCPHCHF